MICRAELIKQNKIKQKKDTIIDLYYTKFKTLLKYIYYIYKKKKFIKKFFFFFFFFLFF